MALGTGQFALPNTAVAQGGLPNGAALQPIETPLVFSGFQPSALQPFATQLQSLGSWPRKAERRTRGQMMGS